MVAERQLNSTITSPLPVRAARRVRPEIWISLATVAAAFAIWWLVSNSGLVPPYFLPTPAATWRAFVDIAVEGYRGRSLWEHFGASLARVLVAFLAGALVGVPLGLAMGVSPRVSAIFHIPIEFYRPLPPLAYYTLLVIWLGIDDKSKVALLFLAALPPIVIATASAVRKVRPDYLNGARSLGANRYQVLRYVIFPACLPQIFTGLRVAIGFTYTTLVAAEMVAGVNGIGWMVLDAGKFLRSDVIFVGIILMGLTGILLDAGVRQIERLVVPWHGKE
ncbi:MAG: ABC transporter permease subunit [Caldilineaceae bacterium]